MGNSGRSSTVLAQAGAKSAPNHRQMRRGVSAGALSCSVGSWCRGSGFSVPLETRVNLASFRAYEWFSKLAPQSAFTRSASQQSQAAYAGA